MADTNDTPETNEAPRVDRARLMEMLGLGGKKPAGDEPGEVDLGVESEDLAAGAAGPAAPPSRYSVEMDLYGRRKGREILEADEALQKMKLGADAEAAVADFHAIAYELTPAPVERCEDELRGKFTKQLLETPECKSLRASTMLDADAAALAARCFADQWQKLVEEQEGREPGDGGEEGGDEGGDGAGGDINVMKKVAAALKDAQQQVDEYRDTCNAFGIGGANKKGRMDPSKAAELFRRIKNNPNIKRIMELAGRFINVARSKQQTKVVHGMDDMVGVELSGDLGRVLPSELGQVHDPVRKLLFFKNLLERQAMSRQYQGFEPLAKGPIIVSVDESGSMSGERINTAKALALAMAWVARKQKRWIALNAWSDADCRRTAAFPPGQWDELALLEWLEGFFSGGTEPPLGDEMAEIYRACRAPKGKTDVVLVTDGVCRVEEQRLERTLAWKQEAHARLIVMAIGTDGGADLRKVADEVHKIKAIDVNEDAVDRVLSI